MDGDVRPFAEVLIVGALIRVLKTPPTTHVVDEDRLEVCGPSFNVLDKLTESIAAGDIETALSVIGIGADECPYRGLVRSDGLHRLGSRSNTAGVPLTCGRTPQLGRAARYEQVQLSELVIPPTFELL